ncbi:unnamed protein product [Prunus brigantina]
MIKSLGIAYRNINSGVCIVHLKRKGWHWHTDMYAACRGFETQSCFKVPTSSISTPLDGYV